MLKYSPNHIQIHEIILVAHKSVVRDLLCDCVYRNECCFGFCFFLK